MHPLYHKAKVYGNWCDVCHDRMNSGWRCVECNFDLCPACYKKRNRNRAEGQLRGDKGVRAERVITISGYLKFAVKLIRPHWFLTSAAVGCLLATSGASLFIPDMQVSHA